MKSVFICSNLPEQNQNITLQAVISAILNLSLKNTFSEHTFLIIFWSIFWNIFCDFWGRKIRCLHAADRHVQPRRYIFGANSLIETESWFVRYSKLPYLPPCQQRIGVWTESLSRVKACANILPFSGKWDPDTSLFLRKPHQRLL